MLSRNMPRKQRQFRVTLWHFALLLGGKHILPVSPFIMVPAPRRSKVVDSSLQVLPCHPFTPVQEIPPIAAQSAYSYITNEFPSLLIVSSTVSNALQDIQPDVEAEVLLDVSHLVVDFSGFFNLSRDAASCVLLGRQQRVIRSMVGRILVLCADWLPDHHIFPEELVIQIFFLMLGFLQILQIISVDTKE